MCTTCDPGQERNLGRSACGKNSYLSFLGLGVVQDILYYSHFYILYLISHYFITTSLLFSWMSSWKLQEC